MTIEKSEYTLPSGAIVELRPVYDERVLSCLAELSGVVFTNELHFRDEDLDPAINAIRRSGIYDAIFEDPNNIEPLFAVGQTAVYGISKEVWDDNDATALYSMLTKMMDGLRFLAPPSETGEVELIESDEQS